MTSRESHPTVSSPGARTLPPTVKLPHRRPGGPTPAPGPAAARHRVIAGGSNSHGSLSPADHQNVLAKRWAANHPQQRPAAIHALQVCAPTRSRQERGISLEVTLSPLMTRCHCPNPKPQVAPAPKLRNGGAAIARRFMGASCVSACARQESRSGRPTGPALRGWTRCPSIAVCQSSSNFTW